jgi:hypothetical protein
LVEQVKLVEVVLPYDLPIIATINQHWKCIFGFQQDRSQNLKKKVILSIHRHWQYHVSAAWAHF